MKRQALLLFFLALTFWADAQKINTDLVYLVKEPVQKTAKTPVLIMLHGYGGNEPDLFKYSQAIGEEFIIFSLRAPIMLPAGGFCWYSLEFLNNRKFKHNYTQAAESRGKVLSFISNACKAYGADSMQVFLLGFSQGAMMAYDIAFAAPEKIKGVIALSGLIMDESKDLRTHWKTANKIRFFIGHGSRDDVVKITDGVAANDYLKSKKVTDLSYHTYNMPHRINAQVVADIKAWLLEK